MKKIFLLALVVAVQPLFACGSLSPEEMKELVVNSIHTRTIKDGIKLVNIPLNESTFFCAGKDFVLIAPEINRYTDLTHPAVLRNELFGDCSTYSKEYFSNLYQQAIEKGGVDIYVGLYEAVQLVTDAEGKQSCRKALVEFIDVVEAACMLDVHTIPLEELPLSACEKD